MMGMFSLGNSGSFGGSGKCCSNSGNSGIFGGSGQCFIKALTNGCSSVIPAASATAMCFCSSALPAESLCSPSNRHSSPFSRKSSPSSRKSAARARMTSSGVGCSLLVLMVLILALLLSGCKTTEYVQVKVPVPVECREPEPARPVMPTETLEPGALPFVLLRAALAEIDRREAYEDKLRAAIAVCTTPINPSQPAAGNPLEIKR